MDKVQQIPLAERLQGTGPRSMGLPIAMGLYAEDFIGLVGQMTGQQERYAEVYATHIKPYDGEGGGGKSVRNMVVAADPAAGGKNHAAVSAPCGAVCGNRIYGGKRQMNYYIPAIIRETSEGTARIPIADMMFQRREIWLTGEITSEVADAVISQILHLDAEDPDAEITMYIDSPGGSVTAGLSIYDVMQAVSADIHTVCVGTAASMAAVLFAAGDRREILRHGEVMIHDPLVSGGISGSALTVQDKSNRLMEKRKVLSGILAEHTGKSVKQIYKVTAKDTYFGAEEAVAFGLADSIVEKMERRSA